MFYLIKWVLFNTGSSSRYQCRLRSLHIRKEENTWHKYQDCSLKNQYGLIQYIIQHFNRYLNTFWIVVIIEVSSSNELTLWLTVVFILFAASLFRFLVSIVLDTHLVEWVDLKFYSNQWRSLWHFTCLLLWDGFFFFP